MCIGGKGDKSKCIADQSHCFIIPSHEACKPETRTDNGAVELTKC